MQIKATQDKFSSGRGRGKGEAGQNDSWSLEERQANEAGEFTTVYHIYNNQVGLETIVMRQKERTTNLSRGEFFMKITCT